MKYEAYNEHQITDNQLFTVTVRMHKMFSVAKWSTNAFTYIKYPARRAQIKLLEC